MLCKLLKLAISVYDDIEKSIHLFVWGSIAEKRKFALVSRESVRRAKDHCGFGIRDFGCQENSSS